MIRFQQSQTPLKDIMQEYAVVQIKPPNYIHAHTFDPVAKLLNASLLSLRKRSKIYVNRFFKDKINIIVGYNLLPPSMIDVLDDYTCIIYQLEQLSDQEGWYNSKTAKALRKATYIWDYCHENIQFLDNRNIGKAKYLPLGYHPDLELIKPNSEQDIDVLFYGSMNPRRVAIIDNLKKECRTETLFGVYGERRDKTIARAKINLNMHFYGLEAMEQLRIFYLLNNRCFVVSEGSNANHYGQSIVTASYNDLVGTCLRYLNDEKGRNEYIEAGYRFLRKNLMEENLKRVLKQDGA